MSANQPTAAWAGTGDPLVVVAGHLVSPQDGFGEIGRMANGDLRRPNRIDIGVNGVHTLTEVVVTNFGGIPTFNGRRAEGTEAVPTAVLNNQTLVRLAGIGFDGAVLGTGGRIEIVAAENFAVGTQGTRLNFSTTALGTAVLSERWRMQAPGHLVASGDNVTDIGASGANRPRDIFLARNLTLNGFVAGPSNTGRQQVATVRVRRTAIQSILDSAFTPIDFDVEDFDTASMHDNAVNPSRLVAPLTGKYLLVATLRYAVNATGVRYVAYRIDGGADITLELTPSQGIQDSRVNGSTVIELAANSFIEVQAWQNSTGALNVVVDDTFASLSYIGE